MRAFMVFAIVILAGATARAATPFKQSLSEKKNIYMRDGVFTGGRAGAAGPAGSIITVRRGFSAKAQLERVIVNMGDREGKPLKMEPTYFQASMDAANRRVILDITQLRLSKVSEQQIRKLFKGSPYVESVNFTLDSEDKSASMVLNLKRPMKLEVFRLAKPARIVMDLKPVATVGTL